MHSQLRRRKFATQKFDQVAIELNHVQLGDATDQPARQRTAAGSDLDHDVVGLQIEGMQDALDDAALAQEMLAEALAGLE